MPGVVPFTETEGRIGVTWGLGRDLKSRYSKGSRFLFVKIKQFCEWQGGTVNVLPVDELYPSKELKWESLCPLYNLYV